MNLPHLCILDTNIPVTANLAIQAGTHCHVPKGCIDACLAVIEHVQETQGIVLDSGGEIFFEYANNLSRSGQPGLGDAFLKWLFDHQWSFPAENRVHITKNGNSYNEFPSHAGLTEFDNSDRKFVAVANAHPKKPTILEATDSKWWGWRDALKDANIDVLFLAQDYIKHIYEKKMGQ